MRRGIEAPGLRLRRRAPGAHPGVGRVSDPDLHGLWMLVKRLLELPKAFHAEGGDEEQEDRMKSIGSSSLSGPPTGAPSIAAFSLSI